MANGTSPSYPPFGMIEIKFDVSAPRKSSLISPIDSLPAGHFLVFCENLELRKLTYYTMDLGKGEHFWVRFGTNTEQDITRPFKLDELRMGIANRNDANLFQSVDHDFGTEHGQALRVEAQQGNRDAPPQIHYDICTQDPQGQLVPAVFDIDPDGTLGC